MYEGRLIDTNILVTATLLSFKGAVIPKLTERQVRAAKAYSGLELKEIYVPSFIASEYEIVMRRVVPARYGISKKASAQIAAMTIATLRFLSENAFMMAPQQDDIEEAMRMYLSNSDNKLPKLSLVDYQLLACAKSTGFPIMTLDKNMQKIAKKKGIEVFDPD